MSLLAAVVAMILFVTVRGSDLPPEILSLDSRIIDVVAFATVPILGVLLATRRTDSPIGWLMLVAGFTFAVGYLVEAYALVGLVVRPGSLPFSDIAAWIYQWSWAPAFGLIVLILVLFPDGRFLSKRWRAVGWLVIFAVGLMVGPVAAVMWQVRGVRLFLDPDTTPGLDAAIPFFVASTTAFMTSMIGAVAHQVIRYRRSGGVEREQLRWLTAAATIWAAFILADLMFDISAEGVLGQLAATLAFSLIPAAITVAILRHRLYEIDRLVSRTITYALVTGVLVGVYLLVVVVVASIAPSGGDLAVAAATLTAAAAFSPVRRSIQAVVDQRFNRRRYDSVKTAQDFSRRLRERSDVNQVVDDLARVVTSTVEPTVVSMWVRDAT